MNTSDLLLAIVAAHNFKGDSIVELLQAVGESQTLVSAAYSNFAWDIVAVVDGEHPQTINLGKI